MPLDAHLDTLTRAAIALAVLALLGAVLATGDRDSALVTRLRSRLLLGVPWGTLVSLLAVLAVYLFVQGGLSNWYSPLYLPFVSWSYLYPLGMLTAPFSHTGAGHITGNLLAAATLAPIAEYAWSHFPTRRGASAFASPLSNPYVRAFVVVPAAVFVVGLGTSFLAWGPLIGFSGVVYAFAGFAVVRYPLATAGAMLARDLLSLVYYTVLDPSLTARVTPSLSRPWWVNVAVQGHVLGFLLGATLALALLAYRRERPGALRVAAGGLLLTTSSSLWAVWWYGPGDSYVLYRGLGLALVVALVAAITVAARASRSEFALGVSRRTVARLVVLLPLLVMVVVAVPVNLSTVSGAGAPVAGNASDEALHVRDYTVTYRTNALDPKTSLVNVSVMNASSRVRLTGVIVESDERELWQRTVTPTELAFDGTRRFRVGGVGWSRTIVARRRGWTVAGNDTVFQVWLRPEGGDPRHVYSSPPSTASPVLDGRNVTVVPRNGRFFLRVSRGNRTLDTVGMPAENATASAGGLLFRRPPNSSDLVARVGDTRVTVASRETYE